MATLPDTMDEKLIGDNPRDRLAVRLQNLQIGRKAERQRIKELEKQVKKDEKKVRALLRLDEYKSSYGKIFNRLCVKYTGFPPSKVLAGGKDVKEIEVLQEIITARAKRNLVLGLTIAALIPIVGWLAIVWSLLEGPHYHTDDYPTLDRPLKFFLLKKRLQKGGVSASSLIAEKYRYCRFEHD